MINPSDCVDFDCDGLKKCLVEDKDGSMLGTVGTVVPQSEFEWDGDPRRGLGDYRIPKPLLTDPSGAVKTVAEVAKYKGNIYLIPIMKTVQQFMDKSNNSFQIVRIDGKRIYIFIIYNFFFSTLIC